MVSFTRNRVPTKTPVARDARSAVSTMPRGPLRHVPRWPELRVRPRSASISASMLAPCGCFGFCRPSRSGWMLMAPGGGGTECLGYA